MFRWFRGVAAVAVAAAAIASAGSSSVAQLRVRPVADEQGTVALGLALRKLNTVGTLMMTTAHPDDENNGLLAMMGHGEGWRTALVTATRGDGGQNEIGPELFDALAVLRTEELGAVHRFDGAEQYFTRAVDFGYSFSIDETLEKWGKEEILGDFVRHIRTIRPDVVVGFLWEGRMGGQHHQTSARLTAEAFRAAADPNRFPEQLREGLQPWQAKKFYYTHPFFGRQDQPVPTANVLQVSSSVYDPLLGRTYSEIGAEARSMHKCQGMSQLLPLAGAQATLRYTLHDTTLSGGPSRDEKAITDGLDVSLGSLAAFAGATPPGTLADALGAIGGDVKAAERTLATGGPAAAAAPLASGLRRVRALRAALGSLGLDEAGRYEIDFRLATKERQFQQALVLAHGLRIDVVADDGLVVPGQKVNITLRAAGQSADGVTLRNVRLAGFDVPTTTCAIGTASQTKAYECQLEAGIPADAPLTTPYFRRLPDKARYVFEDGTPFGLPFRPTPFRVSIDLGLSGVEFPWELPVQYRYEGAGFSGEKRMELTVVPAVSVRVTPEIAIFPLGPAPARTSQAGDTAGREVRATVINHRRGEASGDVRLDVPSGWTVKPRSLPVRFAREDEELTVRFRVMPSTTDPGEYRIKAVASAGGVEYGLGYEVVEYPHTRRQHVVGPAETRVKVLDVRIAPGLTVGYVMGVGDEVPAAVEQLGARLELLTSDDLAWGDLSRFDAIVTGVRAYERRLDLRATNSRLLEYAERGGTVIVQYNKFEFNDAQFGPYPAKVSSNRVTDERAPVTVLVPSHPVFTTPNRIDSTAWDGWVQERGLYFLGERDDRYVDLVETADTFEFNPGTKRGALVESRVGKGRWIYLGLNLWRQLPAGTEGAYRLMANILSLGKAPTGASAEHPE